MPLDSRKFFTFVARAPERQIIRIGFGIFFIFSRFSGIWFMGIRLEFGIFVWANSSGVLTSRRKKFSSFMVLL